jgi:hypothetical protein
MGLQPVAQQGMLMAVVKGCNVDLRMDLCYGTKYSIKGLLPAAKG